MKKVFVQNLVLLLLLNLLIKPIWILGIDRQVQNVLGEDSYGLYFSLFSLGLLLQVLQDLGINNFNNRHMAQNEQLFESYFPKIFSLKILLNVLAFGIIMLVALIIGHRGYSIFLLALILLNQSLLSLILFVRSNLGGLHLFKKDRIVSILDRALAIITVGAILLLPNLKDLLSIELFILAQTGAYAITLLVSLGFLFGTRLKFKLKFSKTFSISILKQSAPYALLVLMMFLYTRTDAIMLERLHENGAYETGVYAKGFRILDAVNMISYLFSVLLLPLFSRMLKNKEDVSGITDTSLRLLILPLVCLTIMGVVFKDFWMQLLYWNTSTYQNWVFALSLINAIPMGLVYVFGTMLTAAEKLKWLNRIAISGVVLNVVLNLVLIPTYGALGAALATVGTQILTALIQCAVAINALKVKITGTFQYQAAIFIGLILFGVVIHFYFSLSDVKGIIFLSFWSAALFFMTGIFKLHQVRNILSFRR